jgi:hypothetical protein
VLYAHLHQAERVELPRAAVEVAGEKPTAVVLEQRVDPDRLSPAQMLHDRFVVQGQVGLRTVTAPAADDRGHVAALAGAVALPAERVDVVATAEEAPDHRHLLSCRGSGIGTRGLGASTPGTVVDDCLCALREREQRP